MAARREDLRHRGGGPDGRRGNPLRNLPLSGLALRVFGALALVILVAVGTLWAVDTFLESQLFVDEAGADARTPEAFRSANTISGFVAILVALGIALLVSVLMARRLDRLVHGVVDAAAKIASGDFAARVAAPRLGQDVDALVDAFNLMADQLQAVEQRRKQLLADLAHELRTPIATLDAYLEAAEDGITALDDNTLPVLLTQTRRLARLADDVGAVSRAEERVDLKFAPLSMAELVHTTTTAAEHLAQARGVVLYQEVDPDAPLVQGDEQRLEQVLTNLLDNAIRHTPEGGSVTTYLTRGTGLVRVEVRDTGSGIPAADLPLVTLRFFRGKGGEQQRSQGSGVGLTIATAIVRAHGGELRVHSSGPDRGTTVMFWLPTVSLPDPASRQAP